MNTCLPVLALPTQVRRSKALCLPLSPVTRTPVYLKVYASAFHGGT